MQNIKFLVIFLFFTSVLFGGSVKFEPFMQSQINIVEKLNDTNLTQEQIETLLNKQNKLYEDAFDEIMINQNKYINNITKFEKEIFTLKKIIQVNKHAGNTYAVIRDEVALKTYKLLRLNNNMIKSILLSLNDKTKEKFEEAINKIVLENQKDIAKLLKKDYKYILKLPASGKIILQTQKNVRNFYAVVTVNNDMIGYIYKFESNMYRLNKYSKYHLISLAVYVNSIDFVRIINPILEKYGLSIMKLLLILMLIIIIYFLRTIVYVSIEKYILKIDSLQEYSVEISKKIKKPIEMLIIFININMVIYVYNDFSSIESISQIFNMIYGFIFTLIIYKIVNAVASIRLIKVSCSSSNVKNDLINVSIKIINFGIIIIGLLIMLFFAGINLTAVLSGLGIGGFAVAFAAKDTISNFFGTLSILFSDVFSQGDWIAIDGHEGVVVEVGLRVTTIRTFDNALIAIPNGTFANKEVKNWNKRILGRRIKMQVGVKYDSKSADIKNAVEQIHMMLDKHPLIATKATKYQHQKYKSPVTILVSKDDLDGVKNNLLVYLDSFGDSSINILVYCFTKSVKWDEWLDAKQDVMYKIMEILEENNLEFAFPSLSVYNEPMQVPKEII